MKRTILTVTLLGALVSSAFSQGMIFFSGGTSTATRVSTNSVPGGGSAGYTSAAGGSFYYALFASAANTNINGNTAAVNGANANYVFDNMAGWTLVGLGTNQLTVGRFTAASQGTNVANQGPLNSSDGSLTVQGIAGGATAYVVAIGWSASIGTSLDMVISWYNAGHALIGGNYGLLGQTAIGSGLALGDGGLVATQNAFGTGAGQVSGFLLGEVVPIPEPSTIALAGLAGLSLLLFRRRK